MSPQIDTQFISIQSNLYNVRDGITQIGSLLKAISALIEVDDADGDTISSILRASGPVFAQLNTSFEDIYEWCQDMDTQRIQREVDMADMQDTDEGQVLRNLSRDLARRIEDVCTPAMRAITQMQNGACEIDAMIQRARDMAGCLRPIHSEIRDPNRPQSGSLCDTIGQTMAPRTLRFATAIERVNEISRGEQGYEAK